MLELYKKFIDTCDEIGIKVLSNNYCCQLLATVYIFGNEDMIFNGIFNTDIETARRRLNVYSGAIPEGKYINKLKIYVMELNNSLTEAYRAINNSDNPSKIQVSDFLPDWAKEIEARYNTRLWI